MPLWEQSLGFWESKPPPQFQIPRMRMGICAAVETPIVFVTLVRIFRQSALLLSNNQHRFFRGCFRHPLHPLNFKSVELKFSDFAWLSCSHESLDKNYTRQKHQNKSLAGYVCHPEIYIQFKTKIYKLVRVGMKAQNLLCNWRFKVHHGPIVQTE